MGCHNLTYQDNQPVLRVVPRKSAQNEKSSAGVYRYGFNTQEKEDEIAQGITSAEFWMYDSRIARRWELDPKPVAWESGYAVNRNNPILYADPLGDTPGPKIQLTWGNGTIWVERPTANLLAVLRNRRDWMEIPLSNGRLVLDNGGTVPTAIQTSDGTIWVPTLPPPSALPTATGTGTGASTSPGTPASGTGTTASGTPASGTPASGTPASGTPASGTPASGTPASGTPASGTPASGPGTGTPGPGTGTPGPGTGTPGPGTGTPGPGTGSPPPSGGGTIRLSIVTG